MDFAALAARRARIAETEEQLKQQQEEVAARQARVDEAKDVAEDLKFQLEDQREALEEEMREALNTAAAAGDEEKVAELIKLGADVNFDTVDMGDEGAGDDRDGTPLVRAAINGRASVATQLLDAGADPSKPGHIEHWPTTPLYAAAEQGHLEVLSTLIGRGADVQLADECGETPLMIAAYHGNNKAVKALLDAGANKEATDNEGLAALSVAVRNAQPGTARQLLDAGADTGNLENALGYTRLHLAALLGSPASEADCACCRVCTCIRALIFSSCAGC